MINNNFKLKRIITAIEENYLPPTTNLEPIFELKNISEIKKSSTF
jgi:hypothetical protein